MSPPAVAAGATRKTYDEAYFAKWYHHPRTRVHSPESVRRKVHMVVGVAEYFLRRKVRTVLDIGAGEGNWRVHLRRLRPGIEYLGLDPSEYAVARYGKRRNIHLSRFEDLGSVPLRKSYDMVICSDVLQYVADRDLIRGLRRIAALVHGVAFLEAYTTGDLMEGDLEAWHARSKKRYRTLFADAGLVPCGLHCHIMPAMAERAVEMELV